MAAVFVAASSQRLINSAAPVTAIPFSVGFWVRSPAGGAANYGLWSLVDTATATNFWGVFKNVTTNTIWTNVSVGAGYNEVATTTAMGDNLWTYVLFRAISATNRRISVLHWNGTIDNAQQTTSRTPASIDRVCLGAFDHSAPDSFMEGSIAEYWMANVDVFRGGGALPSYYLRQLAYGGPFSIPHIERNLVDYRSLRQSLTSDRDKAGEYYIGGQRPVRQIWTNTNGVTLGPHVPLPVHYESPFRTIPNSLLV